MARPFAAGSRCRGRGWVWGGAVGGCSTFQPPPSMHGWPTPHRHRASVKGPADDIYRTAAKHQTTVQYCQHADTRAQADRPSSTALYACVRPSGGATAARTTAGRARWSEARTAPPSSEAGQHRASSSHRSCCVHGKAVFGAGCGAPAAGRRLALMMRRHHLQSRERPPAAASAARRAPPAQTLPAAS